MVESLTIKRINWIQIGIGEPLPRAHHFQGYMEVELHAIKTGKAAIYAKKRMELLYKSVCYAIFHF
jgi:hypothetical protein